MKSQFLWIAICCSLLFSSGVVLSQPSTQEELDNALRKELGQETPTEKKKSKNPKQTEKKTEEIDPIRERYESNNDESGSTLLWILVKISIVLGVLVGAFYYVLKYLSKNKIARYPVQGEMKVLSTLSLGPGKELQMVEVSGFLLVVGVSENSVQLIKEIDDRNVRERIFSIRDSYEPPTETFVDYFVNSIKNTTIQKPIRKTREKEELRVVDEMDEELLEEMQIRQRERLERLKKERDSISGKNKKESDY
jgi:flagellar protein FliO/FliZ